MKPSLYDDKKDNMMIVDCFKKNINICYVVLQGDKEEDRKVYTLIKGV